MGLTSALVLLAVVWFMLFLIILPIRVQTQGDLKEILPGTHAGAPEHHHLKRKAFWTTVIALAIWAVLCGIILSGWITVDGIEQFMGGNPAAAANGTGG